MAATIPRLLLIGVAPEVGAVCALGVARAAAARGLAVVALVVGHDRDAPSAALVRALGEATGRVVHRLDTRLMPTPVLQGLTARVAEEADLCLVVGPGALAEDDPLGASLFDLEAALEAPAVVCADLAMGRGAASQAVRAALTRLGRHGRPAARPALVALGAESIEGTLDEAAGPGAAAVRAAAPGHGVVVLARGGGSDALEPGPVALNVLLDHARAAEPLPPPARHRRRHVRARVGVVLDECFDLYDEESMTQLELAGAELVPFSALDDEVPDELDGLVIGDGRIEAFSARLCEARWVRAWLHGAIVGGMPTVAAGGGMGYLARGMRTLTGSMHGLVGALDAVAVAEAVRLPRGHVEVELGRDSMLGPAGARLRGYVQRGWRLRGLAEAERGAYRTVSGPPDQGVSRGALVALHFRLYWPSYPRAAASFVDHCLAYAAHRDEARARPDGGEALGGDVA